MKEFEVQVRGLSEEFSRFCLWKSNKYRNIKQGWASWNRAQWNSSRGGSADWGTINLRGKAIQEEEV